MENVIYYECHITLDPVFDDRLLQLQEICKEFKFKVADLFLKKRKEDTLERSCLDSFCTGKDKDLETITKRMNSLSEILIKEEFVLRRKKIECVIYDERFLY